ncbi:MAG: hypothetical protein DIU76_11585, partial [Bacillota bacterium]
MGAPRRRRPRVAGGHRAPGPVDPRLGRRTARCTASGGGPGCPGPACGRDGGSGADRPGAAPGPQRPGGAARGGPRGGPAPPA